jgi:hypothetical protein
VKGNLINLKGSKVNKTSQAAAASQNVQVRQLQPVKGDRAWVEIALHDQDGEPVANQWFRVEFADGTVKEGRTSAKGKAWVPGPVEGGVKVSFPGMDEDAWKQA